MFRCGLKNTTPPASLKEEAYTAGFAGKSEALSVENALFWVKFADTSVG